MSSELSRFCPIRFPLVSEDGRLVGEMKVTPGGFYRAIITTPMRRQTKLFRSKHGGNEYFARKWIAEQIKIYDDFKSRRGEFVDEK